MDIDFITAGAAAALGFGIGWTASWAAGKDTLDYLREQLARKIEINNGKDRTIREQGRTIAEHVAAEQARADQRKAAAVRAGEASAARAAAKRSLAEAAAKVTKPAKPAPKAKRAGTKA